MSSIDDSGPAFPSGAHTNGKIHFEAQDVLTLRDYFAAKAMQAIMGFKDNNTSGAEDCEFAYKYADQMLKARSK